MTPSNTRRIVGCPGGGLRSAKTRKLSELAARAATRYGPDAVLIASLTKTAAEEIGRRADAIPREQTATLHAHALRALGFDHTMLAETPAAMREFHAAHPALAPEGRGTDLEDAPAQTGGIHAQVINHRARLTPRSEWTPEQQDYARIWEDWCAQTGRRDFTSLVEECLRERIPPLSRPRVILADESQDLSALEFELLRMWSESTESTVVVGDTQQAIYAFRGADPDRLEQIPVARGETLTQSYRCPRAVAQVAQAWAAQLPGDPVTWTPRDADGTVTEAPYALRDTDDVIAAIDPRHIHHDPRDLPLHADPPRPRAPRTRHRAPQPVDRRARLEPPAWTRATGAPRVAQAHTPLRRRRPHVDVERPLRAHRTHASRSLPTRHQSLDRRTRPHRRVRTIPRLGDRHHRHPPHARGETATDRLLSIDRDAQGVVDWWTAMLRAKSTSTCGYAARVWKNSGVDHLRPADDPLHRAPQLVAGTVHSDEGWAGRLGVPAPELSKEGYYHGWLGGGAGRDSIVRMMYVGMTRARETLTCSDPGCPEYAPIGESLRVGVAA